jgi:four helix bundle protein
MAFRFRNFNVYKDSKELHKQIVSIVNKFPRDYWYLADQIRRSSLSVVLNIAEGSAKQSDKDFNRFLTISLGSIHETVASMEIAFELKLIRDEQFRAIENQLLLICKQLGGFSKKLKSS